MASALEIVSRVNTLASPPTSYLQLCEALKLPEDSQLDGITKVIASDPSLAAKVLKIVNSALYGFERKIESIRRAVIILGLQQIHDLVLGIAVSHSFRNVKMHMVNIDRFWQRSVFQGVLASGLGRQCGLLPAERLFVAGLLADIGHLVLYQTMPEKMIQVLALSEQGESLANAEQSIIGCHYAEVGAALLEYWKLPEFFSIVIGSQTHPVLAGDLFKEAALLCLATWLSAFDNFPDEALSQIQLELIEKLDLTPPQLKDSFLLALDQQKEFPSFHT